jgi:hypothetical protein
MCFDGNYLNNDDVVNLNIVVRIQNAQHVNLVNNDIINGRQLGVFIYASTDEETYDVNMINNRVIENKWNGISYCADGTGVVSNCLAELNYVSGSTDIGIDTYVQALETNAIVEKITISNNIVIGDGGAGYGSSSPDSWFPIRIEAGQKITIDGNKITTKGDYAILDSAVEATVSDLIITNNQINTEGYSAIQIIKGNGCLISGNTINLVGEAWSIGIWLNGVNYTRCYFNKVYNVGSNTIGIQDESGSNYNYFIGNDVTATTKINSQGSNNRLLGNIGVTDAP